MATNDKKSYRIELIIATIGAVGVLGGALFSNWDKIFPLKPNLTVHAITDSQALKNTSDRVRSADDMQTIRKAEPPQTQSVDPPRLYRADWAYRYFHQCKAGTYNVIVKSLEGDQYAGVDALRDLGARFPGAAFRLVNTLAADGASNQRFAIFAGNGLSRSEAEKLVAIVKQMSIANDAYMVLQGWDADQKGPEEWEIMR